MIDIKDKDKCCTLVDFVLRVFLFCSAIEVFTILQFTIYYFATGQTPL